MTYRYPVAIPDHQGKERQYLIQAIESGFTSSRGPFVEKFEEGFALWFGVSHAISTSQGTAALKIAVKACGIGQGDEVLVPSFTMIASVRAVTAAGATPVFIDCDDMMNIDVTKIEEKVTSKTKAIMPVHIYGRPCDMDPIMALAAKHDLYVIEDACEAHGATYNGRKVGTIGDIGCFSLYANKIITSGEGGVAITNDAKLAEIMRKERSFYFTPDHSFLHEKEGDNYRMTNLQAAVACAQLERIDEFLKKRSSILSWYERGLPEVMLLERPEGSVLWMMDVLVDADHREKIRDELEMEGIETRVFFKPMEQQPAYGPLPYHQLRSHSFAESGFYLPVYTLLTEKDVGSICRVVNNALLNV